MHSYVDAVLGAQRDRRQRFDEVTGKQVQMEGLLDHGEQESRYAVAGDQRGQAATALRRRTIAGGLERAVLRLPPQSTRLQLPLGAVVGDISASGYGSVHHASGGTRRKPSCRKSSVHTSRLLVTNLANFLEVRFCTTF